MKNKNQIATLLPFLLFFSNLVIASQAETVAVKSPNGKVSVELNIGSDSKLYYQVRADRKIVISPSRFGIVSDNVDLGADIRFGPLEKKRIDETYPLSGVHSVAVNRCNETTIIILAAGEKWFLDVRAYDDGVALRCRLEARKERHIQGEVSEWRIPPKSIIWFQSELGSYEGTFSKVLIDTLSRGRTIGLPVTVLLPSGNYALLSEANLVDYSDLAVKSTEDKAFKAFFHAEPGGWKTDDEVIQPWRTTIIAPDLNSLVNSDMIHNLCPPPSPDIINAGWIKPGRAGWNWWSTPNLIYNQQNQWVDWTKQLGFEYYLIDAGWTKWQDGSKNAWDCLTEVVKYGKSAGIDIWIWVHSKEVSNEVSRRTFFENASKAGVAGIKIDFVPKCTRAWSNWYEATLRDAAALKLMIDFHGAVKPTGRNRTWPNELTREAVRGHEWHITRYKRTLAPDHDCIIPFTRFVQGAADYTPTVFNPEELRGYTWSREVAQAIVFTSPFLCYADHPENYLQNPALEIIKSIPSTWDETIVLPVSEIGKCAAFARRKGDTWFIGVINGGEKTDLDISMNFLNRGSFIINTLEDQTGKDNAVLLNKKNISNRDHLKLTIRPGGGFVGRIREQ